MKQRCVEVKVSLGTAVLFFGQNIRKISERQKENIQSQIFFSTLCSVILL
jgi:hypothetical protein